jgi:hypothetical protein
MKAIYVVDCGHAPSECQSAQSYLKPPYAELDKKPARRTTLCYKVGIRSLECSDTYIGVYIPGKSPAYPRQPCTTERADRMLQTDRRAKVRWWPCFSESLHGFLHMLRTTSDSSLFTLRLTGIVGPKLFRLYPLKPLIAGQHAVETDTPKTDAQLLWGLDFERSRNIDVLAATTYARDVPEQYNQ